MYQSVKKKTEQQININSLHFCKKKKPKDICVTVQISMQVLSINEKIKTSNIQYIQHANKVALIHYL